MTKTEFQTLANRYSYSISQKSDTRERALNDVVKTYGTGVNPWSNTPREIANYILRFSQCVVLNHNRRSKRKDDIDFVEWSLPKKLEPFQIALILKYKYGKDILNYDKKELRKLVWQYDIRCFNVDRIKDYLKFYIGENNV